MVRVHQAHIAHAKMRARKVNLLHPTQKASRKIEIARQPNAREQPVRGAARAGGHVSVSSSAAATLLSELLRRDDTNVTNTPMCTRESVIDTFTEFKSPDFCEPEGGSQLGVKMKFICGN